MRGRFDYKDFDEQAEYTQEALKQSLESLISQVEDHIREGRARSLAITKLEEAYMWIGKAIRDDQIIRHTVVQQVEENKNESTK